MRALLILALLASPVFAGQHDVEWNPPARFDHAPTVTVIQHLAPYDQVRSLCNAAFRRYGFEPLVMSYRTNGCAVLSNYANICEIFIASDPRGGTPISAIVRHERGHCAGWPADHPE